MNASPEITPVVKNIFHPSDFSTGSELAFAHALKFALIAKADLHMLHVAKDTSQQHWSDFPGVRETLERWGLLPQGSAQSDVIDLGIGVHKAISESADPVKAASEFLERHFMDMIVLATHQHEGATRWLHKSVAEPIARKSGVMTLFVPSDTTGFVSAEDGALSLRNFVIPIDREPWADPAVESATRAAAVLGIESPTFTLVYVGEEADLPKVRTEEREGWTWKTDVRKGDVVDGILGAASDADADLIVMTTAGHHGFLDALRGSTTEQVLRGANCPLLAIPAS